MILVTNHEARQSHPRPTDGSTDHTRGLNALAWLARLFPPSLVGEGFTCRSPPSSASNWGVRLGYMTLLLWRRHVNAESSVPSARTWFGWLGGLAAGAAWAGDGRLHSREVGFDSQSKPIAGSDRPVQSGRAA